MKKIIFIIPAFLVVILSNAQSFHVDFLFNPGLTISGEYIPSSAINDSTDFQFIKGKVQFVKPLKTKFGVDLKSFDFKKMDAKASQLFLTTNYGVIAPSTNINNNFSTIYNANIGLTALTASARNGIWLYSANAYFSENSTTLKESPMPNFRGYITNVKIKNLKFIYFYGLSLTVNQGKFYPIPVLGFRAKLNSKLNASIVFPTLAKLSYKLNSNTNIDIATNFDGINAIYREGSVFKGNDNTVNYRQLKSYLGLNTKFRGHYKLFLEIGYASFRKFTAISSDYNETISPSMYFSLSINYHFGKSVFDNFINKVE